jgi:Sec-independent protein secretion pathway component TatC
MEQESDLLHLFGQHSLLLFILGALLLMGLLFGVGILVGRRSERRTRLKTRENDPGR